MNDDLKNWVENLSVCENTAPDFLFILNAITCGHTFFDKTNFCQLFLQTIPKLSVTEIFSLYDDSIAQKQLPSPIYTSLDILLKFYKQNEIEFEIAQRILMLLMEKFKQSDMMYIFHRNNLNLVLDAALSKIESSFEDSKVCEEINLFVVELIVYNVILT